MSNYRVRTAQKTPRTESDCCDRPARLRVRVENDRRPVAPHVYLVCGNPEHWLWAVGACQNFIDFASDDNA